MSDTRFAVGAFVVARVRYGTRSGSGRYALRTRIVEAPTVRQGHDVVRVEGYPDFIDVFWVTPDFARIRQEQAKEAHDRTA